MQAVHPAGRSGAAWALLAATAVVACSACTTTGSDGESASSCAFLVEYENRTYSDVANVNFTVGAKIGTATLPPCDDTPNDNDDGRTTPASTTAYAVKGLDPSIAITVDDAPSDVLLVSIKRGEELPPEVKKLIDGS
ncbi:hypothetical protein GCM10009730_50190 [Streptomyces albidochromogenes]|uniref:DUF6281 family protein n=1 Tax=Streptomyces albidochromogenes TaxID=329524 RepID=UPI001FCC1143|nr:DUF6281 family protein [Streptomyces albidochromogenes]